MPITLTDSEVMALADIVAHYLLYPDHSEVFVDVHRHVETTPEQLLAKLLEMRRAAPPAAGREGR